MTPRQEEEEEAACARYKQLPPRRKGPKEAIPKGRIFLTIHTSYYLSSKG